MLHLVLDYIKDNSLRNINSLKATNGEFFAIVNLEDI